MASIACTVTSLRQRRADGAYVVTGPGWSVALEGAGPPSGPVRLHAERRDRVHGALVVEADPASGLIFADREQAEVYCIRRGIIELRPGAPGARP